MEEKRSEELEKTGIIMGKIGRDLERFGKDIQVIARQNKSDICNSLKRRKDLMERDSDLLRELLPAALELIEKKCKSG